MRILIVSTSERIGGASVAANRLMHALRENGIDAKMLVRDKQTNDPNVVALKSSICNKLRFIWERLILFTSNGFNLKKLFEVSIANTGFDITRLAEYKEADLIHLHWINQGMLSLRNLQKIKASGKLVVWTMHDMWPTTGICHYAHACSRFTDSCGKCPFLGSKNRNDLSARTFSKKMDLFKNWDLTIVTVSTWLSKQVLSSPLLREKKVLVVPNTLPLEQFKKLDKLTCRVKLGLPTDNKILVFGAGRIDSPIKGFHLFREALNLLGDRIDIENIHLVLFGNLKTGIGFLEGLPVPFTWLGSVDDEVLVRLYNAADALVASSLYETFGQTLIEAQACGCIPVCFNNSGQTDIVEHLKTGYLAEYLSIESLRDGIVWALNVSGQSLLSKKEDNDMHQRYSAASVSEKYLEVYNIATPSKR